MLVGVALSLVMTKNILALTNTGFGYVQFSGPDVWERAGSISSLGCAISW